MGHPHARVLPCCTYRGFSADREPHVLVSVSAERNEFGVGGFLRAQALVDGVPVNPVLPDDFWCLRNEDRPSSHLIWWGVPFIVKTANENWPNGERYDVRCLDGGGWDRPTVWGFFETLGEAVQTAKAGPAWRRNSDPSEDVQLPSPGHN